MVKLITTASRNQILRDGLSNNLLRRNTRAGNPKFRNNFDQNQNHGLSLGVQIGGSGKTRIIAADSKERIKLVNYDPNIYELNNEKFSDDMKALSDILKVVSKNAEGTVRIVASIAGFPTNTGKEVGGIKPKQKAGLLYMPNIDFTGVSNEYKNAKVHKDAKTKNRIPYLNALNFIKASLSPHTKLTYIDEAHPKGLVSENQSPEKNHIIFEVQNDTVSTGESAAALLAQENQNSKGIVSGSGFNDSNGYDFDSSSASSRRTQNNESGQAILPEELLLDYDKAKDPEKTSRAELYFAGGNDKDDKVLSGIRRTVNNLVLRADEKIADELKASIQDELNQQGIDFKLGSSKEIELELAEIVKHAQSRPVTNIEIEKLASRTSNPNKLLKALTMLKFNQMARYLIQKDLEQDGGKEYLQGLKVIGVTGSSIVGNFTAIPELEIEFLKPFQDYSKNITLHKHQMNGIDGMQDIINEKAALAKQTA